MTSLSDLAMKILAPWSFERGRPRRLWHRRSGLATRFARPKTSSRRSVSRKRCATRSRRADFTKVGTPYATSRGFRKCLQHLPSSFVQDGFAIENFERISNTSVAVLTILEEGAYRPMNAHKKNHPYAQFVIGQFAGGGGGGIVPTFQRAHSGFAIPPRTAHASASSSCQRPNRFTVTMK